MWRRLFQSSSPTPSRSERRTPDAPTTRSPRCRLGRKRHRPEVRARPGRSRAVPGPTSRRGSLAALA
eukprot:11165993-Lingulodinium_polyedra.AAC.1